jgi:hypothetical protein
MYMRCDEKMDKNWPSMQPHTRSARKDKPAEVGAPSDAENYPANEGCIRSEELE